ncbi:hypothetical protein I2I11_00125 [Pontibacter sp. 172403-2]|uniref:hypothetical protein n=1 Tax=Pontibacter rufus TaxID=2791028 RepID=UPI0018AFB2D7|nr:hypothetical protein [Pontibacter sp. 172403-2]MBF9251691.1 hypothetical protein [Pontibacter sp. 172403-2]
MEANKKDWGKTAEDTKGDLKTGRIPDKHIGAQYRQVSDRNRNDPNPAAGGPGSRQEGEEGKPMGKHTSQGHATDENDKGTATNTNEATLRAATTDSSRMPKNTNDDGPTGGNIR